MPAARRRATSARVADPRLGDDDASGGICGRRRHRQLAVDGEGPQVAVVDADDLGAGGDGARDLVRVVGLDQRVEARGPRGREQRRERRVGERRDDEQDRVGARRSRLGDLVAVDDEVLAQDRQLAGRARGAPGRRGAPPKNGPSVSTDSAAAPPAA